VSIEVANLSKLFGKQKALDDVSFTCSKGEIVGFLGPNGAGKSTTMKVITSYLPPTSGTVQVCGLDVVDASLEVRSKIGYLPEHNPLYLDMYVKEYLQFVAKLRAAPSKNVDAIISRCGLTQERTKLIGSLSKGYRQRVGLAQALLHDPEVLILDEPTTGLDPNQIVEIRELIKDMSAEKTVLLSTHIMQEVSAICDKVVVIHKGKIVADDRIENISSLIASKLVLSVAFSVPLEQDALLKFQELADVRHLGESKYEFRSDTDIRTEIFAVAGELSLSLLEVSSREVSLEEVFKELTTADS